MIFARSQRFLTYFYFIAIGSDCAIEFPNERKPLVKDEDKKSFETMMKRVNTGASVEEEGQPLTEKS